MLWRSRKQKEKVKRILPYIFLGIVGLGTYIAFIRPYLGRRHPNVEISSGAAAAFDQKMRLLKEAYYRSEEAEVRINEVEASSRLNQLIGESAGRAITPPSLNVVRVRFIRNAVVLEGVAFNLTGDLAFEIRGGLRTKDRIVEFVPDFALLGGTSVLPKALEPNLRAFSNTPEIRALAVLPHYIKNIRVKDGELILAAAHE